MTTGLLVSLIVAAVLGIVIFFIVTNTPKPNTWTGETTGEVPEGEPGLGTFETTEVKVEPATIETDPVIEAVADVAATVAAPKPARKPRAPKVTKADVAEATATEAAPAPAAKKPRAKKATPPTTE